MPRFASANDDVAPPSRRKLPPSMPMIRRCQRSPFLVFSVTDSLVTMSLTLSIGTTTSASNGDLMVTLPSAMEVILPVNTSPLDKVTLSWANAPIERTAKAVTKMRFLIDGVY